MMTREEFIKELEFTDDVINPGVFSVHARKILVHDAQQRAEIARLREALKNIVKIRFLLGNDPKLNPAYEMGEIAKQALKEKV